MFKTPAWVGRPLSRRRARLNDRGQLEVAVADTGVGIAPEDRERVFEAFWQVGAGAGPSEQPGTGLGLALVRQFVRLMGGDVRVESEPGHGSTFTFWLPARGDVAAGGAADSTAEMVPTA
jgi:signal transduction histidine kinase